MLKVTLVSHGIIDEQFSGVRFCLLAFDVNLVVYFTSIQIYVNIFVFV